MGCQTWSSLYAKAGFVPLKHVSRLRRARSRTARAFRTFPVATAPASAVQQALHLGRVAIAGRYAVRRELLDAIELLARQLDAGCSDVLFQPRQVTRARNRDHIRALREHPSQRELRGGAALRARERLHFLDHG